MAEATYTDLSILTPQVVGTVSLVDDLINRIRNLLSGTVDSITSVVRDVQKKIQDAIDSTIKSVADWIDRIVRALRDKIDDLIEFLDNVFEAFWQRLGDLIDTIRSIASQVANTIANAIKGAISGISETIANLAASIVHTLSDAFNVLRDRIGEIAGRIAEAIGNAVRSVGEFVGNLVTQVKEFAGRVAEGIRDTAERVIGFIREKLLVIWAAVQEAIQGVYEILQKVVSFILDTAIPTVIKFFEESTAGTAMRLQGVSAMLEGILDGDANKIVGGFERLTRLTDPHDIIGTLWLGYLGMQIFYAAISTVSGEAMEPIRQEIAMRLHIKPLTPSEAANAYFRGLIPLSEALGDITKQGLDAGRAKAIIEASRPLLPPGAIQEAFLRGLISEAEHDALLRKYGYTDEDIRLFKALYFILPTPSDLIRMAVREAFSPEIAQKFGQYEDFPETFAKWAAKLGISEEWAKAYWAAHWDLPSATQGFEMLHRGIITEEELKLLLRALDVMPFWREKLIQLSYEPYTRVDVRRMYQLGILSFEDVVKAYKDLGYDEQRARNLAEFTVRYYAPEDKTELDEYRQLSRNIFIQAYKKGVITREELIERLKGIKYTPEDAEFLARVADAEIALQGGSEDNIPRRQRTINLVVEAYKRGLLKEDEARDMLSDLGLTDKEIQWNFAIALFELSTEIKDVIIDGIHRQYVERTITKEEALIRLSAFNLRSDELERLFILWDAEREARTRKPSEAVFRTAYRLGLISLEEYKEELRGLGYADKYVDLLVAIEAHRGAT